VGLPHHAIPLALLFFNLGVEVGQLSFVAVVLAMVWLFRRAMALRLESALVQRVVCEKGCLGAQVGVGVARHA
jgi:hypothetical protein